MSFQKNINKYWDYLEQKYSPPRYVGKVKYMDFESLKNVIDNKNEKHLKHCFETGSDLFKRDSKKQKIDKNFFPKELLEIMQKNSTFYFG